MDIYEIVGYQTGVTEQGVNYIQAQDAFQKIRNGFIYRQVLQSRQGFGYFAPRLADESRVFGIFEYILPDQSRELLAFDKNFLYKYNTLTSSFDQILFSASMGIYNGFDIGDNDLYISGTAYPDKNNNGRFVFTGEGITPNAAGSAIFFYDGIDVKDFTSVVDNPDYAPHPGGQLSTAIYVVWFNERLNFIVPVIGGTEFSQGTLFSGIRNSSGDGDKFNVAGSGLFQADTYQFITGCSIIGQIMVHNYDRMAYVMEKTRDAFNPYFGRAIPGPLGTNAKFSAVSWNETIRSHGKTGILGTDGRQNLRVDNKIPYFTSRDVDQPLFNLTYGGFDRLNNQFLWAYKQSGTDGDTQDAVLVGNYEENTWSVFDQRFSVFGQTDVGNDLTWDQIDETAGDPSWATWDTTEDIWDRIGLSNTVQKTLAGDDLGFIYELNKDFDDYFTTISNVTIGPTTTLTVAATGIKPGDLVAVSNVEGMTELNNFDPETNENLKGLYNVLSSTPTSIEINVDSTMFSPYTPNTGNVSTVISFEATTIPFNPYRSQGKRCYVSMIECYIEKTGGSVLVDVYADQQTTPFIRDVLLMPDQNGPQSVGEYISMTVDQEANFITFVLKQQSLAVQLKITSMRIHCEQAGFTHG